MSESTQTDGVQTRAGSPAHVQTPDEWSRRLGVIVRDPDGWRNDGKSWDDPISEDEFRRRASLSTVEHPFPVSPVQATGHAGDSVSPVTDDMARLRAKLNGLLGALLGQGNPLADEMRAAKEFLDHLSAALAGCTVNLPAEDQWCHFYGGPDPDNAAGNQLADGEDDARAGSDWVVTLGGKGIARRSVHYGPWEVVDFTPDLGAGGDQHGDA